MCTSEIDAGIADDWKLSRRLFLLSSIAVAGCATTPSGPVAVAERDVSVTTADGTADAVLLYPDTAGQWPAVLMWPDIRGLRPVFREMGKRLAAEGYVVLVPNPFYRSEKTPAGGLPYDFSDPQGRETLIGFRRAMSDSGIDSDARAYLGFLDDVAQTDTGRRAGVQGYCMGGPLSFRTAAAVPGRIGAVGSFHGGGLVTDEPSSPHLLIPQTQAEYLVAVAQNDDARAPEDKNILRRAFDAANTRAIVDVYAADHGWCVPGSQAYDMAEAERAWAELLAMYGRALT